MFSIYCTYTFYQVRGISQSFSEILVGRKLIGVSEMSQIYLIGNSFRPYYYLKLDRKNNMYIIAEEFNLSKVGI